VSRTSVVYGLIIVLAIAYLPLDAPYAPTLIVSEEIPSPPSYFLSLDDGVFQLSTSALTLVFEEEGLKGTLIDPACRGDCRHDFSLAFVDSNQVQPEGLQPLDSYSNFLHGSDPSLWKTHLAHYEQVVYPGLYDGIDLIYYFGEQGLKYDVVLEAGADISQVKIRYDGIEGLRLDGSGNLIVNLADEVLDEGAPISYQGNKFVDVEYRLLDPFTLGYEIVSHYDPQQDLIVDPLLWATYIGGDSYDDGEDVTVGPSDNVFVTGTTFSTVFPTTSGVYDSSKAGTSEMFVSKFSSDGTTLLWSTYLGGSGSESPDGILADSSGIVVVGNTDSTDYPTVNAFQSTHGGGTKDIVLTKLATDGASAIFSTYFGGGGDEWAGDVASYGDTAPYYITGKTDSSDFPTSSGAYDTTTNTGTDAFVAKFTSSGSMSYSTYLGGSDNDQGTGIDVDSAGSAYVTGHTYSTNFPTTSGAYDTTHNGNSDFFVSRIDGSTGATLGYSTFIGGTNFDTARGLMLDSNNGACVAGSSDSSDFPTTTGAYDTTHNTGKDVVALCLTSSGSMNWATYIGSSGLDSAYAIYIDSADQVTVTGATTSTGYPTTSGAYDTTYSGGNSELILSALSADGSQLLMSTFVGGSATDWGFGIDADSSGNLVVAGYSYSTNFPVTSGAYDTTQNDGGSYTDTIVFKIEGAPLPATIDLVAASISGPSSAAAGDNIQISYTIRNDGSAASGTFSWRIGISSDQVNVTELASGSTSVLAGATDSSTLGVTVPGGATGSFWYFLEVDTAAVVSETNEGNNELFSTGQLTIDSGQQTSGPDLTVLNVIPGNTNIQVSVKNLGDTTASGTIRVDMFWNRSTQPSVGTTGDAWDTWLSNLAAGDSKWVSFDHCLTGVHNFYVIVDTMNQIAETDESNNNLYVVENVDFGAGNCDVAFGGNNSGLPAPNLISPVEGTDFTNLPISFIWEPVSGANVYQIQISEVGGDFADPLEQLSSTNDYYLLNSPGDGTWEWRVRAGIGSGGADTLWGEWSGGRIFFIFTKEQVETTEEASGIPGFAAVQAVVAIALVAGSAAVLRRRRA